MTKQGRIRRISFRMWSGEGLNSRRFNKAIDKMERSARSQDAHMVFVERGWENSGGRGLIHNGRKR